MIKDDKLDYLRAKLKLENIESRLITRIAADTDLSIRTIYNVIDPGRDPRYSTVRKVYDYVISKEKEAERKAKRKAAAASKK